MRARLVLLAAALATFGASLGSGFHFDDYAIFSDPVLREPLGFLHLWGLSRTRPLTFLSFWLNWQTFGGAPLGYHLFNLAVHAGAVLLAWECLRRLLPERAALLGAALFAVHPLQAEAVNYVWGRAILLAAFFCFASLLAWLEDRPWTALACFALALLAKEECAAFPLVLALVRRSDLRKQKSLPAALAAMAVLALAAAARVVYATSVTPGAPAGLAAGISPWHYFLAQGIAVPRYLQLLVLPYGFTVDPGIPVPAAWLGLLGWAVVAAAAVLAWRYRAWWVLAGLALLLPSSSVFPASDLAADRRMYLPMFAFAAAGGLLLARVKSRAAAVAAVALVGALGFARTTVWMSDVSLWSEAVRRAPGKVRPKIQLSRSVPAARALELLDEAARLAPGDPRVPAETGRVFLEERQPDAALSEFGRALALDPTDARNFNNRGVALQQLGQTAAARQDFERALALDPTLEEARENLRRVSGQ